MNINEAPRSHFPAQKLDFIIFSQQQLGPVFTTLLGMKNLVLSALRHAFIDHKCETIQRVYLAYNISLRIKSHRIN